MENERVWIFILSKELSNDQLTTLNFNCNNFVNNWFAHDKQLDATCDFYKNRLLIFKVNESAYNASGCSIDKLTRFIKAQEELFSVDLLNRLLVAYESEEQLNVVKASQIKEMLNKKEINENTLVINTTASNSEQLTDWKKPLKDTWLRKYLSDYSV